MSVLPVTLIELQDRFSSSTWSKALSLVRSGAVLSVEWKEEGVRLVSKVRSSNKKDVYRQTIDLKRSSTTLGITGQCSCYVGFNCKHVTAALIARVQQNPEPTPLQKNPQPVTLSTQEEKLLALVRFIWEQKQSLHDPYLEQFRALHLKNPQGMEQHLGETWWKVLGPLVKAGGEGVAVDSEQPIQKASKSTPVRRTPAKPQENREMDLDLPLAPELQGWLDSNGGTGRSSVHTLLFALDVTSTQNRQMNLKVRTFAAKRTRQGLVDVKPYVSGSSQGQYVMVDLPLMISLGQVQDSWGLQDLPLTSHILHSLLETGRVYLQGHWDHPITMGKHRSGTLGWRMGVGGVQHTTITTTPEATVVLPHARPWYLDASTFEMGPVELEVSEQEARRFLTVPPVKLEQGPAFARALKDRFGGRFPTPQVLEVQRTKAALVPRLTLYSETLQLGRYLMGERIHTAKLEWTYLGQTVTDLLRPVMQVVKDGVIHTIERDSKGEQATLTRLKKLGLDEALKVYKNHLPERLHSRWTFKASKQKKFDDDELWLDLLSNDVPALKKEGWEVIYDSSFDYPLAEVSDWYADLGEGEGWFDLELGVVVAGKKIPVLPLLTSLLRTLPAELLKEELGQMGDQEHLHVHLDDGTLIPLQVGRVRSILGTLIELYGQHGMAGSKVRLPLLDAARIAELEEGVQGNWSGGEKLRELGQKLRNFGGIQDVALPAGLQAELRPYQKQGVNWLQFLREYGLNGILADDMGLGKTLQTLTHLLIEKEQGRLTTPALIVAPTSLMHNWLSEAQKFTPDLQVLVLQGKDRKGDFERIREHDVVLTTYPLIPRDFEVLSGHTYHAIILDEAQNIKNSKSATSKAISLLKSEHRLCLTGTPLENHLGELWSLFHFLMPGFLGDERHFGQLYRQPIEKQGDVGRRVALAKRIRPFILRRTKGEVAKELPEKTEMVVKLDLEGPQRDLYETLRVSVQKQVQQEIASKGLARSHIMVLDALLKLRQVCCDPRLLSLSEAKKVKGSVKLDWFKDTVPSMVEEGRRVLVFSQFATLLSLLEETLRDLNIPFSKITGDTQDRPHQIKQFQSGQTQVFLISLKAGGVGLNLTAADTVIHYDPWWNPAAENQATDRAYRIGQDKPVFVYKLITSGTLEEKILGMQARKAALASGVLEGGLGDGQTLTSEDIQHLLSPL